MADRPVSLDLRTPAGQGQGDRTGSTSGGLPRQAPDGDSVARFSQSMRGQPGAEPAAPPRSDSSPFGLFFPAAGAHPPGGASAQQAGAQDRLVKDLQDGVKRLLVSEDQRSLRLDLDAELFPGVVVRVYEDAGAWVAEFGCSQLESFNRLAEPAQEMAIRLAESLSRDSVWRVLPEGLDPGAVHGPVEAFASAPGGLR